MMLTPGTYTAKVYDYTTKTLPNGNVIVEVMFKETESGSLSKHTMHTTEKTLERTLKTLDLLGVKAGDLDKLADGRESGAIDLEKVVQIVVAVQKDKNGVDTEWTHVQWVNSLEKKDSKPIFDRVAAQGTKAKLSALNGKLAALQQSKTGTDGW